MFPAWPPFAWKGGLAPNDVLNQRSINFRKSISGRSLRLLREIDFSRISKLFVHVPYHPPGWKTSCRLSREMYTKVSFERAVVILVAAHGVHGATSRNNISDTEYNPHFFFQSLIGQMKRNSWRTTWLPRRSWEKHPMALNSRSFAQFVSGGVALQSLF